MVVVAKSLAIVTSMCEFIHFHHLLLMFLFFFRCLMCRDFDFCEKCEANEEKMASHCEGRHVNAFVKIRQPVNAAAPAPRVQVDNSPVRVGPPAHILPYMMTVPGASNHNNDNNSPVARPPHIMFC